MYMKKSIATTAKITLFFVFFASLFTACNKDTDVVSLPALGDPALALNGTWKLQKLTQTDQVLKAKDKPVLDVTEFVLNGGAQTITFDKASKSYTVSSTARVNYLGTGGTYAFDDPQYPTALTLTTAAGASLKLTLGAPLRPDRVGPLLLKYERYKRNKQSVSYNYTFSK